MNQTNKLKPILKDMILFSWPLVVGQMGQMLFGIGDIMVAGRYSTEAVAAIGLASGIFAPFMLVGIATMFALGPLMAQSIGGKRENTELLPNGMIVAFAMAIIITIASLGLYYNFHLFGFEENLEKLAKQYFLLVIPSLLPIMVYQAFKEVLQAHHDTLFANGLILVINVANVFFNIALMWGFGPIPELGVDGAAIATLLSRFLMAAIITLYALKKLTFTWKYKPALTKEIIHLGLPIAIGVLVEVMVFSTVTVLVGRMTILASAAHNIALNYSGLAFMIPMAIGSAASVKIGHAYGAKNIELVKDTSIVILILTLFCMMISATVFWFMPTILFGLSTTDPELIEYGKRLLFYVAIFQIPDGLQVALWGILRGLGVTKIPMLLSFVANWLIGFPIGVYFAFSKDMEASGLWLGLTVGLIAICSSLLFLLRYQLRKIKHKMTSDESFIPVINPV